MDVSDNNGAKIEEGKTRKRGDPLLAMRYPSGSAARLLLPREGWKPYPTIDDRPGWQALHEGARQAHIALAESVVAKPWPQLPASLYLEYSRNGNRTNFETPYFERRHRLGALVLAECIENQGRFVEAISDAVWSICEEATWCLPAHVGVQQAGVGLPDPAEPVVDLFAAETGAQLAWTVYLTGSRLDAVSPMLRMRVTRQVMSRVLNPCGSRNDWWWMGFEGRTVNNWNPWINSNWLACALLIEPHPARRVAAVDKIIASLDRFVAPYPQDGGCDEGPSYWGRAGASMFDCLDLLHSASGGRINAYQEPIIQEIGKFIYRAHIAGDYFINFADAPARLAAPPAEVYAFGKSIGDPAMVSFGAWLAQQNGLLEDGQAGVRKDSLQRALRGLFLMNEIAAVENPRPPFLRDVWLKDIQVMTARDQAGGSRGFFLAAKGGHNDESHNHNDVGSFIVFLDGKPLVVDAGVETYTRKTFSDQRYAIWTMQSAFHSLPTINGVMQSAGAEFAARGLKYEDTLREAYVAMDIAGAYPPEAKLSAWRRAIVLARAEAVEIEEEYELAEAVEEITISLITPCDPDLSASGRLYLRESDLPGERKTAAALVKYDPRFTVTTETIPIADERLGPVWGERLVRVLFRLEKPPLTGRFLFKITR